MADDHAAIGAWFLGPRAENAQTLSRFFNKALTDQAKARQGLYSTDPVSITTEMQTHKKFIANIARLEDKFNKLSETLATASIPFWSPRYNAHMNMENTFPSVLGYILTILYNPNNVALEASPLTTVLEEIVGEQLCLMLGYHKSKDRRRNPLESFVPLAPVSSDEPEDPLPQAWGHIACDGSVANLESLWAARNLKYYPFALKQAITSDNGPLKFLEAEDPPFQIELCTGSEKAFLQCSDWELLNLKVSAILDLPDRLYKVYGISQTYLANALNPYLVQSEGLSTILTSLAVKNQPQLFVGTTRHYSWDKAAAVLGIGNGNVRAVHVDDDARMDTNHLDQLLAECIKGKESERTPVYQVVVIMGSTEQGAVDPLTKVLALREKYHKLGLSFVVHCDAAWGGYFASMINEPGEHAGLTVPGPFVPMRTLSAYVTEQVKAFGQSDSVTIDPHKSGYTPYPAGGLCYRDGRMRYLVTWTSPIVFHDGNAGESIGVYGIEGSKPGAAAVGAYLSHEVIGLHTDGYGKLLGQAMFTCDKLYSIWTTMTLDDESDLIVVPFNLLPSEKLSPPDPKKVKEEKEFILKRIANVDNEKLVEDKEAWDLFRELGGDVMINAFACNFKVDGKTNSDINEANYLNNRIFQKTSVQKQGDSIEARRIFLTSTKLSQAAYGGCLAKFKQRLGLDGDDDLFVLVNVTMSPWPTSDGFLNTITNEFKTMAIGETKACVKRNKITEDHHGFIMQGTDKLYLVHLPMFYMANHRYQVIISGDLDADGMKKYLDLRAKHPDDFFVLGNAKEGTLETFTTEGVSWEAVIFRGFPNPGDGGNDPIVTSVKLSNVKVVVKRSMATRDLLPDYPMQMPFHLYGTKAQQHIDHCLLKAPGQQLNSDQVTINTNEELSEDDLSQGVIAVFSTVYERSLQPMQRKSDQAKNHYDFKAPNFDFAPGNSFKVTIYKHPDGKGNGHELITKGIITLGKSVYVDDYEINMDGGMEHEKPHEPTKEGERHVFSDIGFAPEPVAGLADEYPVVGDWLESSNQRRGQIMAGWTDTLGKLFGETQGP